MRIRALAVAATVAVVSASVFAQGPRRDGNWQVTIQMQMAGLPQPLPPQTVTQCITKEAAADPAKSLPQAPAGRGGAAQSDCKMSDYKTNGPTVTFTMTCTTPQPMTMNGEFTYGENTYDGTMKMEMSRGSQPVAITAKYTGKRLGDCTK
jgi:hypothetical protein